jgi:hypothetical protein
VGGPMAFAFFGIIFLVTDKILFFNGTPTCLVSVNVLLLFLHRPTTSTSV